MSDAEPGPPLVVLAAGRARRYGGCKPLAPVGPGGEAVIDLVAGDAVAAGFATIVLVVSPVTGPAIRYHVEHRWPGDLDVAFATQESPLGTVHAVLAAHDHLRGGVGFGVANADDLYGAGALALLVERLGSDPEPDTVIAYRLRHAIVGDSPVTRGICAVDADGRLSAIDERRAVRALGDGRFVAEDGRAPAELDGDTLVSMNLWGFGPAMLATFERAMAEARDASEEAEVLLPEVVGRALGGAAGGPAARFEVLAAPGRCIGVTHPGDLGLVQAEIARQVGAGDRPAQPWPER